MFALKFLSWHEAASCSQTASIMTGNQDSITMKMKTCIVAIFLSDLACMWGPGMAMGDLIVSRFLLEFISSPWSRPISGMSSISIHPTVISFVVINNISRRLINSYVHIRLDRLTALGQDGTTLTLNNKMRPSSANQITRITTMNQWEDHFKSFHEYNRPKCFARIFEYLLFKLSIFDSLFSQTHSFT